MFWGLRGVADRPPRERGRTQIIVIKQDVFNPSPHVWEKLVILQSDYSASSRRRAHSDILIPARSAASRIAADSAAVTRMRNHSVRDSASGTSTRSAIAARCSAVNVASGSPNANSTTRLNRVDTIGEFARMARMQLNASPVAAGEAAMIICNASSLAIMPSRYPRTRPASQASASTANRRLPRCSSLHRRR